MIVIAYHRQVIRGARPDHLRRAVGPPGGVPDQARSGLIGVWRGGVSLVGVVFTGVGFIGGRSPTVVAVLVWNVMGAKVRMQCSRTVSAR